MCRVSRARSCLRCWVSSGVRVVLGRTVDSVLRTRGPAAFNYLVGLQRWSIRLLAYQASLVDEYPPFSFADAPIEMPTARAAVCDAPERMSRGRRVPTVKRAHALPIVFEGTRSYRA